MKNLLNISKQIGRFAPSNGGVFSIAELKNLIFPNNKASLFRSIKHLIEADIIQVFCRGFYVTKNFDIQVLSQRICNDSYISFGTILAKELIIGSVPTHRLMSIKLGATRKYQNPAYLIEQLGITPELFMGFENVNGVNIATPEKAFLDVLYYYQKGKKFSFDIYSDINYEALDRNKLASYLKSYKNPKFLSFVRGILNG